MHRGLLLRLLLTAAALAPAAPAIGGLRVVATTPDLAAIAAAVGGPDVQVDVLSVSGQDPHAVDPKPSLLLPLSRADLLVLNGLDLEVGWLPPLMVNARNAAIQPGAAGHLDASTLIQKLGVIAGRVDRSRGDVHPGGNPHYLYDPRAGRQVALALGERMARLDAAGAAGFRSRARDLADALRRLAQEGAARARALPPARRRVVAYHDSLAYLHDWLNLEQVATVEPKPGVQPTPSHVTKVLQAMRGGADAPRVVLQEEFYPRKTSDTLARLAGAEVVILPGGARFAAGETYLDRVRRTEEVIHAALAR